ncbi:MAG: TIGR03960 family B12-binding radical SAM protein [Clostridiales bacterium]|nr:TIGR03960 family B12-binding radical SAM protein [Clostridiales bacterium]MDY3746682.1 TIGR03960 family B12-binding radical SAM protein [Lachnospiraceae bacterium]
MRKLALDDEILLKVDKPARYLGNEVNAVYKEIHEDTIRFAMAFPDVYEIGMSYLGIQIIYDMLNRRDDVYCERVYSPWTDLDAIMREKNIPLFALESQDPVKDFDFLAITIQYEMCYTNILQLIDLSHIPMFAKDRKEGDPIVIGGGPCAYNPEPLADFFDIFYIGEGETVYYELMDLYKKYRHSDMSRYSFLREAAKIEGLYVPMLYDVAYNEDGTIADFGPKYSDIPEKIKKQVVTDLSHTYYPSKPVVPFIKVTQDRVVLEIQRGCIRGCRFCQAGMVYRPNRERDVEFLKSYADQMLEASGHEEISLSSLSSSDYSKLPELIDYLIDVCSKKKVNISLPSLRIDAFSLDVMSKVQDVKKSSLTFAPEAGTQRMRNVINKGLTEEDILKGATEAFVGGWNRVKLYFMLGLPTETYEDIEGIAVLSNEIAKAFYSIPKEQRPGNGRVDIVTSTSFFVPKPFTPFQWVAQNSNEQFLDKQRFLNHKIKDQINHKSIKYNWHDVELTRLEGILARGDRKLCRVLLAAYENGCLYDSWSENFKYDMWLKAFEDTGVDPDFYTLRERSTDEILPWDFIDAGVSKQFLIREWERAKENIVTPNCRQGCSACGCKAYGGGVCYEN